MRETREWSRPLAALGVLLCAFVAACHAQEATTSAGGGEQPMPTIPVPTNKPTCDELDDCANCVDPDPWCIRCNRREVISIDRTKCLDCEANCMHCYHQDDSVHPAEDEVTVCMRCDEGYLLDNSTDPVTCLPCGSRCHRCEINGEGKCDEGHCYAGYRYNADEQICEQCGLNCNNCDTAGPSKCDSGECYDKYYYSSLTETCQACGQYCSNCDSNGAGKCDSGSCDAETVYVEATQTCERCDPNCNACADNGPGKCDSGQCKDPWALSVSNNCAPCDSHCNSCQSAGQNLCDPGQCHARYYHNPTTSVCQACADHCLQCSVGGGLCDAGMCMEGYGYKANSQLCEPCPSNCKTCDISNEGVKTCSECVETFKLTGADNSVCDFCPDNCHTCVAAGLTRQCVNSGCDARYAINTNGGTCHACPDNCATCTYSSGGTKCTRGGCDAGFADRSSDGKCYACPTSCSRCTDDGLSTKCDYDYCTGRTVYSPVDATCPECPSNCDSCYFHTDGTMKCAVCEIKYTLTENDVGCAECPANCIRCYFDGAALKCYDQGCEVGYVLNNAHECSSCPSRCDDCLYDTVTDRVGLCKLGKCEAGYIQATTSSRTCLACSNCDSCTLNTAGNRAECTGNCNTGYVKRDSDKTCIPCPAGCNQCTLSGSTTTTCITNQCDAPSFVQVTEPSCVACPIGCTECSYDIGDAEYYCTRCDTTNGFILRDSKCYPCPLNCNRCTFSADEAKTTCTTGQCKAGFTTQDGLCVACAPNCLNCNSAGPGGCNSCEGGYTEAAGNTGCESCASNCNDCNTAGQCSTCSHGYIPSGTECVACADFCDVCTLAGAGQCDTCMRGYAKGPTDNQCYACPDNCQYCTIGADEVAATCVWGGCKPGFIMKDSQRMCEACSTGCAQCKLALNDDGTAGDEICFQDSCKLGYIYNPTSRQCDSCPSKCIKCTDANTCEINGCDVGYTSDAPHAQGQCLACSRSIGSVINCYKCDTAGEGKCDAGQCHPGYALNSDLVCRACAANCESCTTPDDCTTTTCREGFVYYAAGTASNKCLPWSSTNPRACDENCAVNECDTMGTCRGDCASYYTKTADNTCARCADNCLTCNTAGTCNPDGCDIPNDYSYDPSPTGGIICVHDQCASSCNSCETRDTCYPDSCSGNNKYNGADPYCAPCASGCEAGECTNQATCWRYHCQDGKGLENIAESEGTCGNCGSNCQVCNIAGADKCDVDMCTADQVSPTVINYERHPVDQTCHVVACAAGCSTCVQHVVTEGATNGGNKCDAAYYCADNYRYDDSTESCTVCTATRCAVCEDDAAVCQICQDGSYQLTCGACTQAGCAVCDTDIDLCDICDEGYVLQSDGTCTACTEAACSLCDRNTADNYCDECADGKMFHSGACTACTGGCEYCDPEDPTTCLVCMDGYSARQTDGSCVQCSAANAANCMQCELASSSQSDTCDVCTDGYVMWTRPNTDPPETSCKECAENCASCTMPGTCETCAEGFRLNGGICVPCPRYCKTCNAGTGNCEDCEEGFYTSGSNPTICSPCPEYCETCTSSGCTTCASGFKHVQNFCTQTCDDPECAECAADPAVCTRCKTNHGLPGGTGVCTQCVATDCDDCHTNNANCDACPADTYPDNTTPSTVTQCDSCSVAIDGCAVCTSATVCSQCIAGKYWDGSACTDCSITDCAECSSATVCTVCNIGTPNDPPATCPNSCGVSDCAKCPGNLAECTECSSGFYLASATECRACAGSNCIACANAPSLCTLCTASSGEGPATPAAADCEGCTDPNCAECPESSGICTVCDSDAFYLTDAGACTACTVTDCDTCTTGAAICTGCTTDKRPNLAGTQCVDCNSGVAGQCDRCESATVCSRCVAGYYLDSVTDPAAPDCEICHPACTTCDGPLQTDCLANSCNNGYYYDESEEGCFKAWAGCTTPGSSGCEDSSCEQYYTSHTGSFCLPCIRFCATCSSVGDCEQCEPGYFLVEATASSAELCVSCGPHCTSCDATTHVCDACPVGFTLENDMCKACAKYCENCDDANGETYGPGKCQPTRCMDGHKYDPNEEDCFGLESPESCPNSLSTHCLSAGQCIAGHVFDEDDLMCYPYIRANGKGCAENCNHCSTPDTCTGQSSCINTSLFNPSGPDCTGVCHANCKPYSEGGCTVNGGCSAENCREGYGYNEADNTCVQCDPNCKICDENGAGNCDQDMCMYGYAYDSSDMSCQRIFCANVGYLQVLPNTCDSTICPVGCKACDVLTRDGAVSGTPYCLEDACDVGYTWTDTNGGACVACTVSNCEVCETTNICLQSGCMYGYARTAGGTCSACPTGCNKCEEVGGAIVCMDEECFGDYVQIAATKCIDCPPSCQQCTYNSQTNTITCSPTMCEPGFVTLANGICFPCPPNCLLCTYNEALSKSTCNAVENACESGYALDANTECQECPNHCAECTWNAAANQMKCDVNKCDLEYAQNPSTRECKACPAGCEVCVYDSSVASETKCVEGGCELGFYQNEDLSCSACPGNRCERCAPSVTGSTILWCLDDQCEDGYGIMDSDRQCYSCGTGCKECQVADGDSSNVVCEECYAKYILHEGVCHACPDNCNTCTYDAVQQFTICDISACASRFAQNAADPRRACMPCPDKCITCTYNTEASRAECADNACEALYDVDASFQCARCADNCAVCTTIGPGKCDTCNTGYTVQDEVCAQCDPNCNQCNSKGASKCDGQTHCHAKFYYNAENEICEACDPNCQQCTSNGGTFCDNNQCNARFVLKPDNQCESCPEHCQSCTYNAEQSRAECEENRCDTRYGLKTSDFTCSACPLNCEECEWRNDKMVCTDCLPDYIINEEQCGACPQYCVQCSPQDGYLQCDECRDGYVLMDDRSCEICPPNCISCEQSGGVKTCTMCLTDRFSYNTDTHCIDCSTLAFSNCIMCTDQDRNGLSTCLECAAGYALLADRSECVPCSAHTTDCGVCEDHAAQCAACDTGFAEGPDGLFCGLECNLCMGPHCDSTTNDEKIVCPDEFSCWMYRIERDGDILHYRGCANITDECTSEYSTQFCQNRGEGSDAFKECKQCCTEPNCNTVILNGDTSGTTHIVYSAVTMVTCVVLAVVGGVLDNPLRFI